MGRRAGERLKEDVVEKRYEVPVEIPAEAAGRRAAVSFDLVNTRADVFLDFAPVQAGARVLCLGFRADEVAAWSPVPLACAETNGCFSTPVAEPPPELEGLSAADLHWHGTMSLAAFTEPAPDGNEAFRW